MTLIVGIKLHFHYIILLLKNGGVMLRKYSIKSYVLVAGLAAVLFLPFTAREEKEKYRTMKKDGCG